jgi:hypothetical protein
MRGLVEFQQYRVGLQQGIVDLGVECRGSMLDDHAWQALQQQLEPECCECL